MDTHIERIMDPHDQAVAARPQDFQRVLAALAYLERHWQRQPPLAEVAAAIGLSPGHFQRLFRRWAGISPKRFLQFLTVEHTRARLRASHSVLDAALDSGLSGPSRLHDLFLASEAMTPGRYRRGGEGLALRFGLHDSPFGRVLIARTEAGVCHLSFVDDGRPARETLSGEFPRARLEEDPAATAPVAAALADPAGAASGVDLAPRGTNFELAVWRALLRLPAGAIVSYGDIARFIGRPRASRAVGRAVGANPVSLLIPCHRVIRASGVLGQYAGGALRKRALVAWEAAYSDTRALSGPVLSHGDPPAARPAR